MLVLRRHVPWRISCWWRDEVCELHAGRERSTVMHARNGEIIKYLLLQERTLGVLLAYLEDPLLRSEVEPYIEQHRASNFSLSLQEWAGSGNSLQLPSKRRRYLYLAATKSISDKR